MIAYYAGNNRKHWAWLQYFNCIPVMDVSGLRLIIFSQDRVINIEPGGVILFSLAKYLGIILKQGRATLLSPRQKNDI